MLKEDFGIEVSFRPDRLCPPLPNRINYLCWLAELLKLPNPAESTGDTPRNNLVLDIGVGASCIYPLLGNRLFGWSFIGSDVDHESISEATHHLLTNHLNDEISLITVTNSDLIQKLIHDTMISKMMAPELPDTNESDDSLDEGPDELKAGCDTATTTFLTTTLLERLSLPEYRGPLRRAIAAIDESHHHALVELEQRSKLKGEDGGASSLKASFLLRKQIWLSAFMTNPPFYDVTELV